MDRRAFTAGFGAVMAGVGIGRVAQADAKFAQGDAMPQGTPQALRVRLANGRFQTLTGFQIASGAQALGLQWTQMIPTFQEDRLDFSAASPVIGSVFRTPFRVRWSRAVPLGQVEMIGGVLVGRVADASPYAGVRVTVGAQDYSWDLPSALRAVSPLRGQGPAIGAIRLGDDGRMLVLLSAQPAF
ncbi:hypothetical protein [Pararhodobacter sp.]|uniref:hypothetical protein n=1 Tax=Pararhodobacter sp. TaxID=2127056 RepID=UPI002AFFE25E|nr:hypothetical protein [Pararhodobacter sp.]